MNKERKQSRLKKAKRSMRVRKKLRGSAVKPRLSVVKTNRHIYAQLINDEKGVTIGSASTLSKELNKTEFNKKDKNSAKKIGEAIGAIAKDKNIKEVVFDRGPFKYHGILAELANAVREHGLSF
ncbi:MAG: 50S ribosomal protein L18 [Chlamydiae bacterium]|nr:50S ribosomal protein L18 [Chlamydiota bacterium]